MLIFCPSCQRQLRLPDDAADKQVKCPACQKVFVAGAESAGSEQIQAPPAPLPTAPAAPEDSYEEDRLPRRLERAEADAEDFIGGGDSEEARRRASAAAAWFYVTVAVTLLVFVGGVILAIAVGQFADMPLVGAERDVALVVVAFTFIGCGVVLIVINVFLVVAGMTLKSFGAKGWVITGIVLAFVQALIFGSSLVTNLILLLTNTRDALDKWTPLDASFDATAVFFNCFAAVKAILTLNNAAVSAEFERRRPRRRRELFDD